MIVVTGGTGYTGSLVVARLRRRFPDEAIRCLIRSTSDTTPLSGHHVELVPGALERPEDVARLVAGARVVVHVANLRFSPVVMAAAQAAGVRQVVLVHTTGMYSKYRAYAADYQRIEDEIATHYAGGGVAYTILRPTMIYGGWRDHNFHQLIRVLARTPVFPMFGRGQGKMQPVHAEDLADSIVAAVDNPAAYGQAFNISGGSVHTYQEILRMVAQLLGRRVWLVPVPLGLALAGVAVLGRLRRAPVTVEQVQRLMEDKVFDHALATEILDYRPRGLAEGLWQQVQAMGRSKGGSR